MTGHYYNHETPEWRRGGAFVYDPAIEPDGAYWLELASNIRSRIDKLIGCDNEAEWKRIEATYDITDNWMHIAGVLLAAYEQLVDERDESRRAADADAADQHDTWRKPGY